MAAFPTCRHRGDELPNGRLACRHPQLLVPDGVDQRTCDECRAGGIFCDKPPRVIEPLVMRNKRPHLLSRVWNFAQSMKAFVDDGFTTVDRAQYERRMRLCNACPQRWNDDCKLCGCRLSLKAQGRAFACPIGRWLAVASPTGEPAEGGAR
jgi:hypothetical protein